MIPKIKIEDFTYPLPSERIAKFPLENRDSSKLLVYRDGIITDDIFSNLSNYIPNSTLLVRNDTKVVPARLFFKKSSGAVIEILCLSPHSPEDYILSFGSLGVCSWKVVVGNLKKWKDSDLEYITNGSELAQQLSLTASLISRGEESIVEFRWKGNRTFSEVLDICGNVPIPPYLNRESLALDKLRYQTVYANFEGSIAAPTAGLHFTPRVFDSLKSKEIEMVNISLHVGAGTFRPVKSEYISDHNMHSEPFFVEKEVIEKLILAKKQGRKILSVGTTSTRTLESLYYIGVSCIEQGFPMEVEQWSPYQRDYQYSLEESLSAILGYLEKKSLNRLVCGTSIIIVPSFPLRVIDIQLTNFHQPQSTLLLLIAAIIGDNWRKIYSHALKSDYRFLSYGDSSLLFR